MSSTRVEGIDPKITVQGSQPYSVGGTTIASVRRTTFELYRNEQISDDLLDGAANLFSNHYGVWDKQVSQHQGRNPGRAGRHHIQRLDA
jgi:hypothetical protein